MNIYTYSEARQNLAMLLDKAKTEGSVIIKRKDGSLFELKNITGSSSPFDIKGINTNISREEIVDIIRESREAYSGKLITGDKK
jgi:antitoxin Phd